MRQGAAPPLRSLRPCWRVPIRRGILADAPAPPDRPTPAFHIHEMPRIRREMPGESRARARSPAVSVIVPTHDRLPLLRRTIASVLGQSLRDLELIVVDDGSTDDTLRYVRSIDDPRVGLIACPHGGNVAVARNLGAAAARGGWLCFLDSDDLWNAEKLERQMRETVSAGTRWSYTRYRLIDEDGRPVPWRAGGSTAESGWIARPLLTHRLGVTICTVMVESKLCGELGGFNERLRSREDYEFVVRLALNAPAHAVDECLASVREHSGRTTSGLSAEQSHLHGAAVFGTLVPLLHEEELRRIARRQQAEHLAKAGARLLMRGALRDAAACFAQAVVGRARAWRIAAALVPGAGIGLTS